jgi:hypothetical protein
MPQTTKSQSKLAGSRCIAPPDWRSTHATDYRQPERPAGDGCRQTRTSKLADSAIANSRTPQKQILQNGLQKLRTQLRGLRPKVPTTTLFVAIQDRLGKRAQR